MIDFSFLKGEHKLTQENYNKKLQTQQQMRSETNRFKYIFCFHYKRNGEIFNGSRELAIDVPYDSGLTKKCVEAFLQSEIDGAVNLTIDSADAVPLDSQNDFDLNQQSARTTKQLSDIVTRKHLEAPYCAKDLNAEPSCDDFANRTTEKRNGFTRFIEANKEERQISELRQQVESTDDWLSKKEMRSASDEEFDADQEAQNAPLR